MARTHHHRGRGWHPYRDTKEDRRIHYRRFRHKVKKLIRQERWEDIPRFRKTCGWLSW